jgi:carboxyl-terminal processing protease
MRRLPILLTTLGCATLLSGPADAQTNRTPGARLDALLEQLAQRGLSVEDQTAYDSIVDSLLPLVDPLGERIDAARLEKIEAHREGRIYSPGLDITLTNDAIRVTALDTESGLELRPTDSLLEIDGEAITELGRFALMARLNTVSNGAVALTLEALDGSIRTQVVERSAAVLPDFEPPVAWPFDLVYLRLHRIRPDTATRLTAELSAVGLAEAYGLVLDLRGADGSDLDAMEAVAALFAVPGAQLFTMRDPLDQDLRVATAADVSAYRMPIMVLVDQQTGGAAEILAAVLRDSIRGAMLFGATTAGDFLLRDVVPLDAETQAWLVTRRLVTADGSVYDGHHGVRPDVRIAPERATTTELPPVRSTRTELIEEELAQEQLLMQTRGDAALRRAVDVLMGLRALDIRPHGANNYYDR